jgi:hypothetical protein
VKFREWAKMYAALVGSVLTALAGTTGVLPADAKPWVALALAVVTAVTTWAVENKTADVPPDEFDFDPPAPNWKSAGPAWDEPGDPPEAPKSLYLVPPLPASYYLSRAEENEVRVA